MSKGLKKAGKIIGGIEDWMVIVLFTAMVVVTMAIVLCRYVFKVQFVPGEEIARYLMIWCGYAGAAMGFRTHAHVVLRVFHLGIDLLKIFFERLKFVFRCRVCAAPDDVVQCFHDVQPPF